MWAVIKKEFKSYFYSPIGYVFIGLFLIMFSIFFYTDVFNYQSTNFEYIFYSGATILTFIVPILTMRTMAEERKTGTAEVKENQQDKNGTEIGWFNAFNYDEQNPLLVISMVEYVKNRGGSHYLLPKIKEVLK